MFGEEGRAPMNFQIFVVVSYIRQTVADSIDHNISINNLNTGPTLYGQSVAGSQAEAVSITFSDMQTLSTGNTVNFRAASLNGLTYQYYFPYMSIIAID